MASPDMREFWDERADEDAYFFVDNRLQYGAPDMARFWRDGERDLDCLLDLLGVRVEASDDVVEIGCGVGRLTRVLATRARSVVALDVSQRMLDIAQQHNVGLSNVEWLLGDGSSLSGIRSGSADACVSHVVFQHIPDPNITLGYIREIGRVLVPGGWAAFQISNDPQVHHAASVVARLRNGLRVRRGRAPRGQNDSRWRGSMVSLESVGAAASDGSMRVERVTGQGQQFCCVLLRRQ